MKKLLLFLLLAPSAGLMAMEGGEIVEIPKGKQEISEQEEDTKGVEESFPFADLPLDMQREVVKQTENLDDKMALLKVIRETYPKRLFKDRKLDQKAYREFATEIAKDIKAAEKEKLGRELLAAIEKLTQVVTEEELQEGAKKVKELIGNGANLNIQNKFDKTPLHIVALLNNVEILQLLLDNKANPNIQDMYGYTPLHIAVLSNNAGIAQFLLKNKVNLNVRDGLGMTPLHLAAEKGNIKLVEILLAHEADPTIKDTYGKTAFDYATERNVIEILRKAMNLKE